MGPSMTAHGNINYGPWDNHLLPMGQLFNANGTVIYCPWDIMIFGNSDLGQKSTVPGPSLKQQIWTWDSQLLAMGHNDVQILRPGTVINSTRAILQLSNIDLGQ